MGEVTPMERLGRIQHLMAVLASEPGAPALPRGAVSIDFDQFTCRTGIDLPDEMRLVLQISNGPRIPPGGIFGTISSEQSVAIESVYAAFPSWRCTNWLPVASDGCGNYYVALRFGGMYPVAFVEPTRSATVAQYVVASGVLVFVELLLENVVRPFGWPFAREEVLRRDPLLASLPVPAPLPWDEDA
jgi:hypothetical protein